MIDFLKPVEKRLIDSIIPNTLGDSISIHSHSAQVDLTSVRLAIITVEEGRRAVNNTETGADFRAIRENLYAMYPGNWNVSLADLGTLKRGATVKDTYFALGEVLAELHKHQVIPILLGGGMDLMYANYRAYDSLEQMVNICALDAQFYFGEIEEEVSSKSYLSKIIMEAPNNLFNFTNIGYQTYFNAQEHLDLLKSLHFEAHRLGAINADIEIVEPVLRDSDIVALNMSAIKYSDAMATNNAGPNGISGAQFCAIARYAGLSDKVSSFGIYEYNPTLDVRGITAALVAQAIWYFVEGVNFRAKDYPFGLMNDYRKYLVPIEKDTYVFYKSNKSGRWWMEIDYNLDNKFKRHALIPCTYQDYTNAIAQELPDRWYNVLRKMS